MYTHSDHANSLQISAEFRQLKPVFQDVIADIAKKMGEGMTKFLVDKVGTMAQWDEVSGGNVA